MHYQEGVDNGCCESMELPLVLPPDADAILKRIQRLVQEAKTVSALNHPNILTIHEFGQEGATPFQNVAEPDEEHTP